MKKTVICHFYNEEWMLPWWLTHHRQYFNHGIMIYYYGWASLEPASIKRRMQIQTKTQDDPMSPHLFTEEQLLEKFKDLQKIASFYNIL